MTEQKIKNVTWISIIRPTAKDIQILNDRFPELHPLIAEDLAAPTIRPSHVEMHDHHLYMVLHFPNFLEDQGKVISHEIDFILIGDTLITVQYEDDRLLGSICTECVSAKAINAEYGKTVAHLLYFILHKFFSFSLKELDQIQERIDAIEDDVFEGFEKEILHDISVLKRNVLDFRRAVKPQQLTLESLAIQGSQLYGEKVKPLLTELVNEYLKVWNLLENHKEALDALYETNNALLVSKTNEIIRVFTVLAFITFIPTMIANFYGMNIHLPYADNPLAFWIVTSIMVIVTAVVWYMLKWKKLV